MDLSTVGCRYYAAEYSKILYKWLAEVRQNINQTLGPQNIPYTSP